MEKMQMKTLVGFCLAATLLAAAVGCSGSSSADSTETRDDATTTPAPKARPVAKVIPSGTILRLSLIDTLESDKSQAGDRFEGSLSESLVVNGATLLPKGTLLQGRVIDAVGSAKVKGLASIRLELTGIVQNKKTVAITTDTFVAQAEPTKARDTGIIAGGAGVGAAIGAIAGGKKGAGIGAIVGGGGGTGVVLATKGNEIHYGPETHLNFTLTNSVEL
jgi:hypothetical protein